MKLWYQSMSRQGAWQAYHHVIKKILNEIKDPDTEIEVHGIKKIGGVAVQYRYLEYLETGEVIENLQTAMKRGFDAFLIGNITDPGLRECREVTNIPVLGLCETSLHLACMMGVNYSLVTINEKFTPRIIENVKRYGLERQLVSVKRMNIDRTQDLDASFTDAKARKANVQRFMDAADATIAEGAEVVIPAGGGVMTLLAQAGVYTAGRGVPILNAITALVKMGEMAVKLDRIMGGSFTSKYLSYAPPPRSQIDEIRKYYGNIYPTVKGKSTRKR
jgi:allantoin racemase